MLIKYSDLEAWKKGINFSIIIYRITKRFPQEEQFTLTSQIQRAALSIPANIAEGCGRDSKLELMRYINIALGSLNEVETFLFIAKELKYISQKDFEYVNEKAEELGRVLGGFKRYLKKENQQTKN